MFLALRIYALFTKHRGKLTQSSLWPVPKFLLGPLGPCRLWPMSVSPLPDDSFLENIVLVFLFCFVLMLSSCFLPQSLCLGCCFFRRASLPASNHVTSFPSWFNVTFTGTPSSSPKPRLGHCSHHLALFLIVVGIVGSRVARG